MPQQETKKQLIENSNHENRCVQTQDIGNAFEIKRPQSENNLIYRLLYQNTVTAN